MSPVHELAMAWLGQEVRGAPARRPPKEKPRAPRER